MKKLAIVFIGLFLMAFSVNVNAQTNQSEVDDATAYANIISTIALSETQELNFGNVISGAALGTVVMPTTGSANRTSTGGVTLQTAIPGQQAIFNVTGLEDAAYTITLPTTVSISNGSETMTITNWVHDAGGTPQITNGDVDFNVGATLNVGAGQVAGQYQGDYSVTVAYQ